MFNLKDLISGLDVQKTQGNLDVPIERICFDSRLVSPGSLFVALRGQVTDGHKYISKALENKASAICADIVDNIPDQISAVQVSDTRLALAQLAHRFYQNPSEKMTVIGVTGTNGKTTIGYLLEAIVKKMKKSPGITGTVNNRFGATELPSDLTMPESLDYHQLLSEMLKGGVTHVISEISSHALFMQRCQSVQFDVCVFTNLSRDHLDFHETMDAYYEEKKKLFTKYLSQSEKSKRFAIINLDDSFGERLKNELYSEWTNSEIKILTFAIDNPRADFHVDSLHLSQKGINAEISSPIGKFSFISKLLGKFNLSNCLASLTVAYALGLDLSTSIEALSLVGEIPGRLQKIPNQFRKTVLVDYAHTPDALEKVLNCLKPLVDENSQLICLFGCGGDRDIGKRSLMGSIASHIADALVITSDNPRTEDPKKILDQIVEGIPKTFQNFEIEIDRSLAIKKAISKLKKGDILLITGKGHEDYQLIGSERISFDDRSVAKEFLRMENS